MLYIDIICSNIIKLSLLLYLVACSFVKWSVILWNIQDNLLHVNKNITKIKKKVINNFVLIIIHYDEEGSIATIYIKDSEKCDCIDVS